jgi:uncharacterized protein (DUF488 family)
MISPVFTIGHSTHEADAFVGLLARHGVSAVADVRSSPYSRYVPRFNREALRTLLQSAGVEYGYLGDALGARTPDPTCYVHGKVSYDRLAATATFRGGVEHVIRGMQRFRVALLCAEKDPLTCHRGILVARAVCEAGVPVEHIRGDGSIEPHDAALDRLLAELDLPRRDLFRDREEMVREAYRRRGDEIAYVADVPAVAPGR